MAQPHGPQHPLFARFWTRLAAPMLSRTGGDRFRRELLEGLSGTVVEVGAGDGANFAFYPPAVDRVVAVEPEPYLRARAARHAGPRIEVHDGLAERLPVADGGADAVVFSLVLCSVPDQRAALGEARRVLRPGGELRVLEHVAAPAGVMRRVQRGLDATIWPRLFGGCHVGRDTAAGIDGAGFRFEHVEHIVLPDGAHGPQAVAIRGRALMA